MTHFGIFNSACFAPEVSTQHREDARCSRGIGHRSAKCPAGRLRLLWLGGNMRSWVLVLLLAALLAARLRLGSAEVRLWDLLVNIYERTQVKNQYSRTVDLRMMEVVRPRWSVLKSNHNKINFDLRLVFYICSKTFVRFFFLFKGLNIMSAWEKWLALGSPVRHPGHTEKPAKGHEFETIST